MQSNENRIIGRMLARELTKREIAHVSGGASGDATSSCTTAGDGSNTVCPVTSIDDSVA